MTNKQAQEKLKAAAAKAADNFDPNMFVEIRDVLALLEELEAKDKQITDLKEAFRIALSAAGIITRIED
ncbi:hypothetical protein VOF77_00090 [Leclercia adecarboxylata]|uniref:Uncharacterized protein n=1 Tax=Leclercia adecarboxylata TaxID=83655 RepID=A0ABU6I2Y8_9ENTR|nr:hypothetical protein [Leclercia adecarboxylata]MDH0062559.1 hypothetical protein [Leclercia adecarboxylata]MEC3900707.1 hypothetical protein [Leclercia adecarboxylata]MEC3935945.1 hypothetical protein [Leclercia adecarboxylata]